MECNFLEKRIDLLSKSGFLKDVHGIRDKSLFQETSDSRGLVAIARVCSLCAPVVPDVLKRHRIRPRAALDFKPSTVPPVLPLFFFFFLIPSNFQPPPLRHRTNPRVYAVVRRRSGSLSTISPQNQAPWASHSSILLIDPIINPSLILPQWLPQVTNRPRPGIHSS